MVDSNEGKLRSGSALVSVYVALTIASLLALIVLSALGSSQATDEAWGHGVIVALFSVLLPLRMRAAKLGRGGAIRAVRIIALVLMVVNLAEAAVPDTFPAWMRLEMVAVAIVMALLAAVTSRRPSSGPVPAPGSTSVR